MFLNYKSSASGVLNVRLEYYAESLKTASNNAFFEKGVQMKSKAHAEWQKGLKDGKGTISTDSGVLDKTQYSFSTRFEDGKGTNPEELIAAAHAGCFSMALSAQLGEAGLTPDSVKTNATVTLEKLEGGFAVTTVHLDVTAQIPGASKEQFETAANNAKTGCPISKLLNAKITMDAKLETATTAGA